MSKSEACVMTSVRGEEFPHDDSTVAHLRHGIIKQACHVSIPRLKPVELPVIRSRKGLKGWQRLVCLDGA